MGCGEMVVEARELMTVEAGELVRLQRIEAAARAAAQAARWAVVDEAGKREFKVRLVRLFEVANGCQQVESGGG